jgi:cytochrome d ubiquinol oxidase subunit I
MELDALLLSRVQFVWVVVLHVLLPAFTLGLATYIAVLEGLYLRTGNQVYIRLSKYWLHIFAVTFALGVVSGIVMPFQFGTNWSRFSDATSDIIGPLLAYEGLTAFFLEAAFLGVLLFGRKLVPPWVHFMSAVLVAVGTFSSAFWILAVNSWMQTPTGYEIIDGRFFAKDWMNPIFNPSFIYRLAHTLNSFFLTTAFVVIGVAAYHLRKERFVEESRVMLSMTLWLVTVLVPAQIVIGDLHGLNTLLYQPAKVAAMVANLDTQRRMPLIVFAIPSETAELNRFEISIPALGSLILTHSADGEVKGLKDWPKQDRAPVGIVFFAFRVMVGIGLLMLAIVAASLGLRASGRLYDTAWFQRACLWASPLGFVAVIAGWTTTEVGRQPWVVQGLMRTRDAVSPSLSTIDVMLSLAVYVVVYVFVFGAGLRLILRLVKAGPTDSEAEAPVPGLGANRPLGAGTESLEKAVP